MLVKALGVLVNLTQLPTLLPETSLGSVGEEILTQQDVNLLVAMETVLEQSTQASVLEQCLCLLVNLTSCSERTRNILAHSEQLVRSIVNILVSNYRV